VIPQQALALMNGSFVLECSERFAQRVLRESGDAFEARLGRAFELAYGRLPQKEETELFREFCRNHNGDEKSWTAVCHALLSSNEFLYVD